MEAELFKLILSGGGGGLLVAFFFWQFVKKEKEATFERERYIAKLEAENEQMRARLMDDERPTRPIRFKPAVKATV
ncbi:hypothetical protein ANRL2_00646 [Anaerolineae bacterium]|nr:hypothetical protein ANRL2_00646 [Anaerolineae bacterium]